MTTIQNDQCSKQHGAQTVVASEGKWRKESGCDYSQVRPESSALPQADNNSRLILGRAFVFLWFRSRGSVGQGGEKASDFVVNLALCGDRLGDFVAQELSAAFSEAVDGCFDGGFGHIEFGGHIAVWDGSWFCGQVNLEMVKELLFVLGGQFCFQLCHGSFEDGEGPGFFEEFFRGEPVGGLEGILAFGGLEVEREDFSASASLFGVGAVALVGEEVLERG